METRSILLVCTANQCRSPMAGVLLADTASKDGLPIVVASAGTEAVQGMPATSDAVAVMAARKLDLSNHRSRAVTTELVGAADLILTMERRHARMIAVDHPAAFNLTFTLREFVRRGMSVGPRGGSEFSTWLVSVRGDRRRADLLGDDPSDDISDPIGQGRADYEETADCLEELLTRSVFLLG